MSVQMAQHWPAPAPALGAARAKRGDLSAFRDALAFGIPALLFVEFHVVGRLFLSELLLLALLPWLAATGSVREVPRWLMVLGALWLVGQVLSDTVRLSPFVDYSRGWSKIAFTLCNIASILLLIERSPRRLVLFGLGLGAGFVLQFATHPAAVASGLPWKFGFGWPVTLAVVLAASSRRASDHRFLAAVVLMLLAAVNLYFAYRSLAGICFLAATALALQSAFPGRAPSMRAWSPGRLVLIGGLALVATTLFLQIYSLASSSGLLGEQARQTYESQSGGAWGLILGGRAEAFVSTQAVIDSPIIGHGSWAKDISYVDLLAERLANYGYGTPVLTLEQEPGLIPTHSYLLGAWVEGGVLGGLFWLAILALTAAVLAGLPGSRVPLAPLVAFVAFALTWDVLFSPYSAVARLTAPYYVAILMFAWSEMRVTTVRLSTPDLAP